jgi:hypothetical protein
MIAVCRSSYVAAAEATAEMVAAARDLTVRQAAFVMRSWARLAVAGCYVVNQSALQAMTHTIEQARGYLHKP